LDKEKIDTLIAESTPKPIPPHSFSLQHTHFRKHHKFATKYFGEKILDSEKPHISVIGKNKDVCKKLYGLGQVLKQRLGIDIGLNSLGNHVWLSQLNLSDPHNSIIHVCLNCGSFIIDDEFIPYTRLKENGD
jgi:hypothetical protein